MSESAKQFYDRLSADYDALVRRSLGRYDEMLATLLEYVPDELRPRRILELGCGTGNLSERLAEKHPGAELLLTDLSENMIEVCQKRFAGKGNLRCETVDMRALDFGAEEFDLVASCIAIHHIPDADKEKLFAKIHRWLRPGGVFVHADQFRGATEEITQKHINQWREQALALGATQDDWRTWMAHQEEHDHHATFEDQADWLAAAGFVDVDCVWRHLLWTVVFAARR